MRPDNAAESSLTRTDLGERASVMAERRAEEMDVHAGDHVFELREEQGCGCGADAQSADRNEHRQQ